MARSESKRPPTSGTRHGNGAGVGGPANGPGWGGPAKGTSRKSQPPVLEAGPGRGHFSIAGEARRERKERLAEEMCELYYTFAHDPKKPDMVRLSAATHLLNRIDGLPVAKIVTAEADDLSGMTDEELAAEEERLREKFRVCCAISTVFRGDPITPSLRQLIIADLADHPRGLKIGYVWVTARGLDGYDVLGWDDEEVSEKDDGARATFRRLYPHAADHVPCRAIPAPYGTATENASYDPLSGEDTDIPE